MIFSENRHTSPIAVEDMLFGIMLWQLHLPAKTWQKRPARAAQDGEEHQPRPA